MTTEQKNQLEALIADLRKIGFKAEQTSVLGRPWLEVELDEGYATFDNIDEKIPTISDVIKEWGADKWKSGNDAGLCR